MDAISEEISMIQAESIINSVDNRFSVALASIDPFLEDINKYIVFSDKAANELSEVENYFDDLIKRDDLNFVRIKKQTKKRIMFHKQILERAICKLKKFQNVANECINQMNQEISKISFEKDTIANESLKCELVKYRKYLIENRDNMERPRVHFKGYRKIINQMLHSFYK